jgi:hypothetical protein
MPSTSQTNDHESPLSNIGSASRKKREVIGMICVRGVFDLEARRKPQAFAADAVSYGFSIAGCSLAES